MSQMEMSISELQATLCEPYTTILDIRPIAAFNGWPLQDEPRGGHIPGAAAFDLNWTKQTDWLDHLYRRNITPDTRVIVYGYDGSQTEEMAERLSGAGYSHLRTFGRFREWSADSSLPIERLPRYEHLVHPEWVRNLLFGEDPRGGEGCPFVVCHAAFDHREDFEAGHIPGAVYLETLSLESPKDWNRRSPSELRHTLRELGIRRSTTVVVYGRDTEADPEDPYPGRYAGRLAAMRSAQLLLYAGVHDVRILNGGLASWEAAGYDISTEESGSCPEHDFGSEIPVHPEYVIDLPTARELLHSPDGALVSVRSWAEHIGDVSGYNYIGKTGRIPGEIFGDCGSDAYHMENYRNVDHTMRAYPEVAANWAARGIVPEKHVAFFCGTGWRASEAFFHAWLMGWPRVSVYDGGWLEWSSDPSNPVEIGEPGA